MNELVKHLSSTFLGGLAVYSGPWAFAGFIVALLILKLDRIILALRCPAKNIRASIEKDGQ
jgi:hypothetical protein